MAKDIKPRFQRLRNIYLTKIKAIQALVAQKPHILVVPTVLLVLMVALGVWGSVRGAAQAAEHARQIAVRYAESAASSMELSLQTSIYPALQIGDIIKHGQNYDKVVQEFEEWVPLWWNRVPASAVNVNLIPNGRVSNFYPKTAANEKFVGEDLLANPFIKQFLLESMANGGLAIVEPGWINGDYIVTVQVSVSFKDVSENETFGIPYPPTDCPPNLCYNPQTRTRWWGVAALGVNVTRLLADMPALQKLRDVGYNYQLWRPPLYGGAEPVVVSSDVPRPQPSDVARASIKITSSASWEIHVWEDSWMPQWRNPLIAVVVVASLICAALILKVMLTGEEHRLVLHSLLPKDTINRVRAEMDFTKITEAEDQLRLVQLETPAQHMLTIINACVEGMPPSVSLLLSVRETLKRSGDVYRPAVQALQTRMQEGNLDAEVGQALVRQLIGAGTLFADASKEGVEPGTKAGQASGEHAVDKDVSREAFPVPCAMSQQPATLDNEEHCGLAMDNLQDAVSILMNLDRPDVMCKMGGVSRHAAGAGAPPQKPILEQVEIVLKTANTWQFDAYALEEASAGRPLSVLSYWLLHTTGLLAWAKMDATKLARFLQRVEEGYPNNPYHNRRHAADVLQTLHMVLQHGGLVPGYADQHTVLSCYLAAIVHDFDHRGRTNDYLINTHDDLAVCYNDRSPMENHHLAAAFGLMKKPEYHFLSSMSKSNWDKLRKLIIELVLATDPVWCLPLHLALLLTALYGACSMKQHFSIVSQFTALHGASVGTASQRHSATSTCMSVDGMLQPLSDTDRLLSLQMALKCADLGHLTAPLAVHLRWVGALEEELFLQGDAERTAGMAISPLCDRNKEGVTKSQVGFFDFVVLPLFNGFTQRFSQTKPLLRAVVANYQHWQCARPTSVEPLEMGNAK